MPDVASAIKAAQAFNNTLPPQKMSGRMAAVEGKISDLESTIEDHEDRIVELETAESNE